MTITKNTVCIVCSSGGHLAQLVTLREWWQNYNHFWVTFDKVDSRSQLSEEKVYWAFHPTNRNIKNLVRNTVAAIRILVRERPRLIISSGAGVAIPFFFIGKLLGAKLVYLEVYDRLDKATLTGRFVYPIADEFLVQWEEQKNFYPKAKNWGQAL